MAAVKPLSQCWLYAHRGHRESQLTDIRWIVPQRHESATRFSSAGIHCTAYCTGTTATITAAGAIIVRHRGKGGITQPNAFGGARGRVIRSGGGEEVRHLALITQVEKCTTRGGACIWREDLADHCSTVVRHASGKDMARSSPVDRTALHTLHDCRGAHARPVFLIRGAPVVHRAATTAARLTAFALEATLLARRRDLCEERSLRLADVEVRPPKKAGVESARVSQELPRLGPHARLQRSEPKHVKVRPRRKHQRAKPTALVELEKPVAGRERLADVTARTLRHKLCVEPCDLVEGIAHAGCTARPHHAGAAVADDAPMLEVCCALLLGRAVMNVAEGNLVTSRDVGRRDQQHEAVLCKVVVLTVASACVVHFGDREEESARTIGITKTNRVVSKFALQLRCSQLIADGRGCIFAHCTGEAAERRLHASRQ